MAAPGKPLRLRRKSFGDIPTIGPTLSTPRSPLVVSGNSLCIGSTRADGLPSSRGSPSQRSVDTPLGKGDVVTEVLEQLNSAPVPIRSQLSVTPTPARSTSQGVRSRLGATPTPARSTSQDVTKQKACDFWTFRKIKQLFQAWDADGDGVISREEVRRVMVFVMDGKASEETVDRLMEMADTDKDGVISVEEFYHWMFDQRSGIFASNCEPSKISAAQSPSIRAALQNWFNLLESNKKGFIDHDDFVKARLLVQKSADLQQIDEYFRNINHDGNSKISWQEFYDEHVRLLDAVPRPLDEKVEMIKSRARKLAEASERKAAEDAYLERFAGLR